MRDYTIRVVEDTCCVLGILLEGRHPLSLAQITQESGLVKNKAFRILATLQKCRFVERDREGRYRLGLRFLSYGEKVRCDLSLIGASAATMDRLAEETGESIFLTVRDGLEALIVDVRKSSQTVQIATPAGERIPLYVGGTPKILLAFLEKGERDALLEALDLDRFTPHTITDRHVLEEDLQQARDRGYVVACDDRDIGACSVAAPIRDHRGTVVAAVSIAGPSVRFSAEFIQHYIKVVLEGAARISSALDHRA